MRIKSINIDSNRILIDEPLEYVSKFLEVTEDARLTQLGKYELLSHAKTYFARKLKSTKDEIPCRTRYSSSTIIIEYTSALLLFTKLIIAKFFLKCC